MEGRLDDPPWRVVPLHAPTVNPEVPRRIFYYPRHGRVVSPVPGCDSCLTWWFRLVPFKAKRTGES